MSVLTAHLHLDSIVGKHGELGTRHLKFKKWTLRTENWHWALGLGTEHCVLGTGHWELGTGH